MSTTSDPNDPRLTRGVDEQPVEQAEAYLVKDGALCDCGCGLPAGFIRPVRQAYVHTVCGTTTTMNRAIAETYARDPGFYGATYCVHCRMHRPVGEFEWVPSPGETIAPEYRRVGS